MLPVLVPAIPITNPENSRFAAKEHKEIKENQTDKTISANTLMV